MAVDANVTGAENKGDRREKMSRKGSCILDGILFIIGMRSGTRFDYWRQRECAGCMPEKCLW